MSGPRQENQFSPFIQKEFNIRHQVRHNGRDKNQSENGEANQRLTTAEINHFLGLLEQ